MATTILSKVKDVVGNSVVTEVIALSDYINGAIAEVADIVPADIFMKYLNPQGFVADTTVGGSHELDDTPSTFDISGMKILSVYREDGSQKRDCMEVNFIDALTKYTNDNSSFKATKLTPVWYVASSNSSNGVINVHPTPTLTDKAYVYYFTHPTQTWENEKGVDTGIAAAESEGTSGSSVTLTTTSGARQSLFKDKKVYKSNGDLFGTCTSVTDTSTIVFSGGLEVAIANTDALYTSGYHDTSIPGFPQELEQAVIFRAGLNIIQSYLSNAVQDDEDLEMQNMLTAQSQSLSVAYQQEIGRYIKGGGA
tara:strand:- start:4783 stop:5709 length:927 start_codon:yes stop_codon:yes gene_type:complete